MRPPDNLSDPAQHAFSITPDDAGDFSQQTRALYVGVAGNVHVLMSSGDNVTFTAVTAGILPVCVRRVYSTGTTATNILGLW